MRLFDLYEGKVVMSSLVKDCLPPSMMFPDMDNEYEHYRFTLALAGSSGRDKPIDGTLRNHPVAVAYTKEEFDIIDQARKSMKKEKHLFNHTNSREREDVHKISPVRKFTDPVEEIQRLRNEIK